MTEEIMAGTPSAPRSVAVAAERLLGPIDWASPTLGYCTCPGRKFHTSTEGKRDCAIYTDRVPTIHCLHVNCTAEVEKTNRLLRSSLLNPDGDASFVIPALTREDKARIAERYREERIRLRARMSLPQILKKHRWTYDEILRESPVDVTKDCENHWKLLLEKFPATDVVWIGALRDSGSPACAANFKTVEEWLKYGRAPGQFTCPVNFKNTSDARSNENVVNRRFLVVESDVLKKDEVGAVFRWMMKCGLKLMAVVDTAGKSLHGWFEFPSCETALDELRLILPALGADPKLFTASQPVRLPGADRDGKLQRLAYLSNEEVCI